MDNKQGLKQKRGTKQGVVQRALLSGVFKVVLYSVMFVCVRVGGYVVQSKFRKQKKNIIVFKLVQERDRLRQRERETVITGLHSCEYRMSVCVKYFRALDDLTDLLPEPLCRKEITNSNLLITITTITWIVFANEQPKSMHYKLPDVCVYTRHLPVCLLLLRTCGMWHMSCL